MEGQRLRASKKSSRPDWAGAGAQYQYDLIPILGLQ